MRKIETMLLGSALAVALSAPAMAGDFHALAGLQGATPAPLQDGVLAATEGGSVCISFGGSAATNENPGGVCLVSDLVGPSFSSNFSVANDNAVAGAVFLNVIGG